MYKFELKILILINLVVVNSTQYVQSQQLNNLLENKQKDEIQFIPDSLISKKGSYIGESFQYKKTKHKLTLKSSNSEQVVLLDSQKIFTYITEKDSSLYHYKVWEYNSNNQVSYLKLRLENSKGKELIYNYDEQNRVKQLNEILYVDFEKKGTLESTYEYNQHDKVIFYNIKATGCYYKDVTFPNFQNMYLCSSSFEPNEYIIDYNYFPDSNNRDTAIIVDITRISQEDTVIENNNYSARYVYYVDGITKEKKIKAERDRDSIFRYNDIGKLLYFKGTGFGGLAYEIGNYEYDSNDILKYVIHKTQKYTALYGKIDTFVTENFIRDTLINAHAVYTYKYDQRKPSIQEKQVLIVYYNNKGLISNTRAYIWDNVLYDWKDPIEDTIIYDDKNRVVEYYLGVENSLSKYQYKELYIYDDEGNKIRYEEYMMSSVLERYVPTYKEFYYYSNSNSIHKTTHTQNISNIFFKAYPNPVTDKLFIRNLSNENRIRYKLISINGSLLEQGILVPDADYIEMTAYPPGLYMLKLYNDRKPEINNTIKISKQ